MARLRCGMHRNCQFEFSLLQMFGLQEPGKVKIILIVAHDYESILMPVPSVTMVNAAY